MPLQGRIKTERVVNQGTDLLLSQTGTTPILNYSVINAKGGGGDLASTQNVQVLWVCGLRFSPVFGIAHLVP